jgi:cell division septation protein DedD
MLSFHKVFILPVILLLLYICTIQGDLRAAQTSYAPQILQHVSEDKVYLLENIRKNITIPSEKLVVDALFSEDGPQAAYLYRKQLAEYPDPSLDELSRSRLSAYQYALNQPLAFPEAVPVIKSEQTVTQQIQPAISNPAVKAKPPVTIPTNTPQEKTTLTSPASDAGLFVLQFGSFGNRENAERLAARVSVYGQISIIDKEGMHKVQLQKTYRSRSEAETAARNLPVTAVAVPLQ